MNLLSIVRGKDGECPIKGLDNLAARVHLVNCGSAEQVGASTIFWQHVDLDASGAPHHPGSASVTARNRARGLSVNETEIPKIKEALRRGRFSWVES